MISFASAGIYIAFQLVVLAALIARSRGWIPTGKFTLGRYGLAVNIAALIYGVGGALNLAWPRGGDDVAWNDKWIVVIGCAIVAGVGLRHMLLGRPYERSDAPYGDATCGQLRSEDPQYRRKPGAMAPIRWRHDLRIPSHSPSRGRRRGLLCLIAIAIVGVVVAEAAFVAFGGMAAMVATIFLALAVTGGVIYAVMRTIGPEDHELEAN